MNRSGKFCALILVLIAAASVFAPLISRYDPNGVDLDRITLPPTREHIMGTDNKGRDIFARILHGGRISLGTALTAASLSLAIGTVLGLCAGYFGGKTDLLIMAAVDIVLSFPSLLLAIGIGILFPPGFSTVVVAIVAVGWASFARLVRGQILVIRNLPFVEAARAMGCGRARILARHLFPQCIPLLLVMAGVKVGSYILTESALSFLGLGAQPPTATWGSLVSQNRVYISSAPWTVFFPGLMISLTVLCSNVLGDALRDTYGLATKER